MKVQIILSGQGGELDNVKIDTLGEDDPAIGQAVADMALKGIQPGDTITVREWRYQDGVPLPRCGFSGDTI